MITREDQRTAVLNTEWVDWKEPRGATKGAAPEVNLLQDSPDTQHDGLLLSPEVRQVVLTRLSEADVIQHRVIVQTVVLKREDGIKRTHLLNTDTDPDSHPCFGLLAPLM